LVRASNTTPVLVTRFEASNRETAEKYKKLINQMVLDAKNRLSS